MKFTQHHDNDADNGKPLGQALTDMVNEHGRSELAARIDTLTEIVAAMAQSLPPWEQKKLAERLGLIHHNG